MPPTLYDFESFLDQETDDLFTDYFEFDDLFDGFQEEEDYSVIGPTDDRFRVRAQSKKPSTLHFPYNTICLLERFRKVGSQIRVSRVSGTLIAPQVVLTAKHCLMKVKPPCRLKNLTGSFHPKIRVVPGADLQSPDARLRRPANPSSMMVDSSRFRVDPNLDYGVIILPRPFIKPDRFMLLQPRSDAGTKTLATLAGYPCDKPIGTMWAHSERISTLTPTHLRYAIDTCPGHSGSPVWLLGNSGIRILLGVHTTGIIGCDNDPKPGRQCRRTGAPVTLYTGSQLNCGVRITCHVIDQIVRWCREFRVRQLPKIDSKTYHRNCR